MSEGEGRRRKLLQLASAAVFVAIAAVAVLIGVNANNESGGDADNLSGVAEINRALRGIPQSGMVLGDPAAPVKLVEFGDLKCPHCASFAAEVIPVVIAAKVRGGAARVEFRNFTIIDDQSETAGAALLAAGEQGRGWNFLEIFYGNQGPETSQYADDEFLTAVAKAAGVPDIGRWNSDRSGPKRLAEVRRTSEEAPELGFEGTPSFAVEGPDGALEPLGIVGSAEDLEAAIDAAR